MNAQDVAPVYGEYYLTGVMETASGFRFNTDKSFEFFFSQGALDRYGKGEYSIKDNKLLLTSKPPVSQGFRMTGSKKEAGSRTKVMVIEQNQFFLKYVLVKVKTGTSVKEGILDEGGMFVYDGQRPDTIQLAFEFCPDRIATFTALPKDNNAFEFAFDPSIMEYYFDGFPLEILKNELKGAHPLLNGKEFRYIKNEEE